jgi:hypothetical protein
MTSAKLGPPTDGAAPPSQSGSGDSKNPIEERNSFFDTLPGRTSDDPLQSKSRSLHEGNLRAAFRVG